jgi:hypothetical protein
MKFIHVSNKLYTPNLKIILYNILNNSVPETKFHGVDFSTSGVMLVLKKFWILQYFGF